MKDKGTKYFKVRLAPHNVLILDFVLFKLSTFRFPTSYGVRIVALYIVHAWNF